jgi:hypothetical protein
MGLCHLVLLECQYVKAFVQLHVIVQLEEKYGARMVGVPCMAHRTNLAV